MVSESVEDSAGRWSYGKRSDRLGNGRLRMGCAAGGAAGGNGRAVCIRRAQEIQEINLGADDRQVAVTIYSLGQCVQKTGRSREAEECFERVLEIQEAKFGPDDVGVAYTLRDVGRCVREAGRLVKAEALLKRALEIQEAKLGADDLQVAYTLRDILQCVRETEELSKPEHAMGNPTIYKGFHGKWELLDSRVDNVEEE